MKHFFSEILISKICQLLKMGKKIYLSFFILYAFLSQGSGDGHRRQKRLITKTLNGDKPVRIQQVPYIVNILKNEQGTCAGSILSTRIIITAAHCFKNRGNYSILSGTSHVERGQRHDIKKILRHSHYNPNLYPHDLALVVISPPIDFENSPNRRITLYNGHIPPHSLCTVSGWGCNHIEKDIMGFSCQLKSIQVPTTSLERCQFAYQLQTNITNMYICTLDVEKCCGKGDSGSPLVFERELAGIYSFSGGHGGPNNPDVFTNLRHPLYREWVISTVLQYKKSKKCFNCLD